MAEKIWVGKGKEWGQYGQLTINICLSDIPKEHITKTEKGKSYASFDIGKMKQADEYGKTHSVIVNTFKPDPSKKKQAKQDPDPWNDPKIPTGKMPDKDLPF